MSLRIVQLLTNFRDDPSFVNALSNQTCRCLRLEEKAHLTAVAQGNAHDLRNQNDALRLRRRGRPASDLGRRVERQAARLGRIDAEAAGDPYVLGSLGSLPDHGGRTRARPTDLRLLQLPQALLRGAVPRAARAIPRRPLR